MADVKISGLPASTTPLAGTEVLPVVQSGVTKKVSVADLTAGRDVGTKTISATNTLQRLATFTRTGASGLLIEADNSGPVLQPTISESIQVYNVAGSVRRFRLRTDSGNLELASGDLVIGTSGKGIDFSATPGTGTSELLADYEEGLHTATIALQTSGSVTLKTANNTLQYVKVGNIVTVTGILIVDSVSSPTGYIEVSLPFTCANLTNTSGSSEATFNAIGAVSTAVNAFIGTVNEATAAIRVFLVSGTGVSLSSGQQMQANTQLNISVTYRTA
jgi:hypothetical protein